MKAYLLLFFFIVSIIAAKSQGDNPCSAVSMTVNSGSVCAAYTAGTTVGATYSNNAANGGTPTCGSVGSPDVWYSFVAPSSGLINIYTTSGTITDGVMQLYSSSNNLCSGTLTAMNCDDDSGPGNMPQLNLCGLTPGNRYFLRFWRYGNTAGATGTFNICFWDSYVENATTSTNCGGGTQVCNNNSFTGNNSGTGVQELHTCNRGCLVANEHNSHWYWLNIGTSGTLEMTIAPTNGTDDYDFAIWGPVNACPPAGSPVRCNYAAYPRGTSCWPFNCPCGTNTNPTGLSASGVGTSAVACDDRPFLTPLSVNAGEAYIMLIDGYTASSQSFNLTWAGSAGLSCVPIILPIELVSFSGKSLGKRNELEWTTTAEVNNDYFTIEKSKDGINFSEFKRVKGAGMSAQRNDYKIYDEEPLSKTTYYRLKQTDFNGQSKMFNVISIESCISGCLDARAYSNGTGGIVININEQKEAYYTIKIFDVVGNKLKNETIYTQKGDNIFTIDANDLSEGIYFVTFENGENLSTQKLYIK